MLDRRTKVVGRAPLPKPVTGPKATNRIGNLVRMPVPAALALGAVLALAACQTNAVRDSRGTVAHLSDWQEIQPFEADLNFPLGIQRIRKIEKQIRDNSIVHNRIYFDFDRGFFRSERLYDGFFGEITHMRLNDFDRFESYVKKFLGDHYVRHDTPRKVTHPRYTSGGFVTTADAFGGKKCIVARAGYKFSEPSYDNDPGTYDAAVFLRVRPESL